MSLSIRDLRRKYEWELNCILRMCPNEENTGDCILSLLGELLWYARNFGDSSVKIIDVRNFKDIPWDPIGKWIYGLIHSDLPDALVMGEGFDYEAAKENADNFKPQPSLYAPRAIFEFKPLSEDPLYKRSVKYHKAGDIKPEYSNVEVEQLISLVDFESFWQIDRQIERQKIVRLKALYKKRRSRRRYLKSALAGISATYGGIKQSGWKWTFPKGSPICLEQLGKYLLDSHLICGLDYVVWTNGLWWKTFYQGQVWGSDIKLDKAQKGWCDTGSKIEIDCDMFLALLNRLKTIWMNC